MIDNSPLDRDPLLRLEMANLQDRALRASMRRRERRSTGLPDVDDVAQALAEDLGELSEDARVELRVSVATWPAATAAMFEPWRIAYRDAQPEREREMIDRLPFQKVVATAVRIAA